MTRGRTAIEQRRGGPRLRWTTRRGVARAVLLAVSGALAVTGLMAQSTPQVVQTRRALDFLGDAAVDWQQRFDCSGCHKQSITLAALATAASNGHDSPKPGIVETLMQGLLSGTSGQDADGCFSLRGQSSFTVSTTFGGRGLEAYDRQFGSDRASNLSAAADCLLGRQAADGSLPSDHTELPVAQGDFVTTAHGVFTWLRALEVGGDAAYGAAKDSAALWLRGEIGGIELNPAAFTTQDKAMLLAGLGRAGAGAADPDVTRMRNLLAGEQLADGSWKLRDSSGGGNAHATGQVVFAMRAAGFDRADSALDSGTQWLLDNQQGDGSWTADHWEGNNPSDVAPSMWGALALATYASPLASLRVHGGSDATVSWSAVADAETYDLIRGEVSQLVESVDRIDLGAVACLAASTSATAVQDADLPPGGEAFFYLMRIRWASSVDLWGRGSGGLDRQPAAGACPP